MEGAVSRVPYGGSHIMDHLKNFLYEQNIQLVTEADQYMLRYVSSFFFL